MFNFLRRPAPVVEKTHVLLPASRLSASRQYDWLREAADRVGSNRELRASVHIELDPRGIVVMVCPIGGLSCAVKLLSWDDLEIAAFNPLLPLIESAVSDMRSANV